MLLDTARMTWKKSQDEHPKADPDNVSETRTTIKKKVAVEAPALVLKRSVMLMVDECHLLWGDARGYVWGPRGKRIVIPIENIRDRQTYYGAVNLLTGQTATWEAAKGNMEYTVGFVTDLRQFYQGRRLVICWDRAPYHCGHVVREYLNQLNGPACPEPDRKIQIELFAPYAPMQNPMEDVWLMGKRAVRQHWFDLSNFQDVKTVFTETITHRQAQFEQFNWYGRDNLITRRRELGYRWE
jgi:hypothetical protein